MVPDSLPSLTTPRRSPGSGGGGARWLPALVALLFLLVALGAAWVAPSTSLGRLDRVLAPDHGGSR